MTARSKVWFGRGRALLWVAAGAVAFVFGWEDSVALVWIASVYNNVVSDLAVTEAADDRQVLKQLNRIEELLRR